MKEFFTVLFYVSRKYWFVILLAVSTMTSVLASYVFIIQPALPDLSKIIKEKSSFFVSVPLLIVVLGAFITGMISYLNKGLGGRDVEKTSHIFYKEVMKLNRRVSKIEEGSSSGASIELTESERNELIADTKKRIIGNTILLAENSLKSDISNFNKSYNLHKLHTDMVYRLESEIDRLNRRGGVNLTIGSTIALIGILSLAYFLYSAPGVAGGWNFSFISFLNFHS